jgi:Mor family transcriptional regulator
MHKYNFKEVIVIEVKEIKIKHLNGIYKDIAETLGIEMAVSIYKNYKGLQITFPKTFLSKEYVKEKIVNEYDGKNTKRLARRYGYSERWIIQIIKNKKEDT